MIDSLRLLSLPVLLSLSLATGSLIAAEPEKKISKERIFADAQGEVTRDGQQFRNTAQDDQFRHQVRENEGQGTQNRYQHQNQQGKQSQNQHRYQYSNQSGSQSMHQSQSGSMNRGGGSGSRGGKGGGGGRR